MLLNIIFKAMVFPIYLFASDLSLDTSLTVRVLRPNSVNIDSIAPKASANDIVPKFRPESDQQFFPPNRYE